MRLIDLVAVTTAVVLILNILWLLFQKFSEFNSINNALKKVPSPPTHWLWGHVKGAKASALLKRRLQEMKQFPKLTVVWVGWMGRLQTHFPSTVQAILNTEEPKNPLTYKMVDPWIGDGLLLSSGKKWKRNRRLLTRAFHFDMLKGYIDDFNHTSGILVEKWSKVSKIAAFEDVSLMTLDTMLKCSMSAETDCQHIGTKHPYIKAVYDMATCVSERLVNPFLRFDFIYYNFTSQGKKFQQATKIAHMESECRIKSRQLELGNRKLEEFTGNGKKINFLDMLILARDENGEGLSFKEIRDEVDTFLFEGHDTTASGISWALYNLARHPEYQKKCREEVQQLMKDREEVSLADLNNFTYLTMCIKESLRLHPPVFGISRQLTKPLNFPMDSNTPHQTDPIPTKEGSQTFPSKMNVSVSILNLHRNPTVWTNPDVYDPERFTPKNSSKRSPFAFVPFSAGPRNCIGQNFAMNEMKIALALLLKSLKFEVDENFPPPEMAPMLVLRASNDIHLKVCKV